MRIVVSRCVLVVNALLIMTIVHAQNENPEYINPVIENFGGIYAIPDAEVEPNANLDYKIVVDVASGSMNPQSINPALNNVARMVNLHAVGGASVSRMHIVLAVHAGASSALLTNAGYQERFGVDNPNLELIKALQSSRVDVTICGQSMIAREIAKAELADGVKVATSMLTTVTTYQSLGYSFLRF